MGQSLSPNFFPICWWNSNDPTSVKTIATGFTELDGMIRGGVKPGALIVVAARPSLGKTALALNIGRSMAGDGHPVQIVSYEMTAEELIERMLSTQARVPTEEFRVMRNSIADAARVIHQLPIRIDDSQPNINQLVASIRLGARKGVKVVIVDYLQLVPSDDPKANRETQVAGVSRKLKQVALSTGVSIIALSQLNRAVELRDNPRPRLADLRESGAIEQDADLVWLLWRPNKGSDTAKDDVAAIDIAKQRNGRTGVIHLAWHGPTTTFANRDEWTAGHF